MLDPHPNAHGEVALAGSLVVYAGTHRIFEDVRGEVTTEDNVLDEADFHYSNSGLLNTLGLIYHAQSNYVVAKVELSNLVTDWSRTSARTDNGINFALGFDW